MNTKYPIEFPRSQRSIEDRNRYKASEFRNLIFYNLVGILKKDLNDHYYNHLLIYAIFLRILTKDFISAGDINDARTLIELFLKDFEDLYGIERVTFNLHAHIHLPKQVQSFGPLHKTSGFPFEGMFQYTGKFRNGTRGLVRQTAHGVEIDKFIHFNAPEEIKTIKNHVLRSFIMNNHYIEKQSDINLKFEKIEYSNLNALEKDGLGRVIQNIESKTISISEKAILNKTGFNINLLLKIIFSCVINLFLI
jgi:hypothetical protein